MTVSRLRKMKASDLEMVLQWRNHPDVRRYMYTSHEISFEEHSAWFKRTNDDPNVHLMIYEANGRGLGFVNIVCGRCGSIADWGFYLSPEAGKGTGQSLGNAALAHAFEDLQLHKLCGQALRFNERSIAFHHRLGFTQEGVLREQHFDGTVYHDVLCFGLLRHEWQQKSKEFGDE